MNNVLASLNRSRLLLDTSLWSAPLERISDGIDLTEKYTDMYHIDVADAHFVPALLFFPDLVSAINRKTEKPIHVHLMMEDPLKQIDNFIEAGADIITVHGEIGKKLNDVIPYLRARGVNVGLAIRLETNIDLLDKYLDQIDLILLMGTPIGIKGVSIDSGATKRLYDVRRKIAHRKLHDRVLLSTDGGIRLDTVAMLRRAGADMITPGSLIFKSQNIASTVEWLHGLPTEVIGQ